MSIHSEHSSYREKLLEHIFIGEVLKYLWSRGVVDVEFLRPEVDNGGYDLVIAYKNVTRYIQLKATHNESKVREQKVNLRLMDKPSGCVVWVVFNPNDLALETFFWFGGGPGERLPDITGFPVATHTKGNAQGTKTARPNIRVLSISKFKKLTSVGELVEQLFGTLPRRQPPVMDGEATNDE